MENTITHIYVIVDETDVWGVWTTPEKAVKHVFKYDLETENGITLRDGDQNKLFTINEAVEKMLEPGSDYPYIAKLKLNPTDANAVWELDR